jgi:hypothetical protein
MSEEIILEVLDHNWNRKALSRQLVGATVDEELGTVGEGKVTIHKDDPVVDYLPNPDATSPYEGRWRLYEDNEVVFAGVIDSTTYQLDQSGNFEFAGKQRGIELSFTNFGRRDMLGWPLQEAFEECLRDNIGKAPMATIAAVTSQHEQFPALNAITGDPFENQMWAAAASGSNSFTIDLGAQKSINSVRVIPPWWDGRWYKFIMSTSTDNAAFTTRHTKSTEVPLSDRGVLVEAGFPLTARYVKVEVTDSTDDLARLASLLVFQDITTSGSDTTFAIPFIENDDSGNIAYTGTFSQETVNGAFAGDGIVGNSTATRLGASGQAVHRFRGTSGAIYCTQDDDGAASGLVFVDGVSQGEHAVLNASYQHKLFEVDNLSAGLHTLSVQRTSGNLQIDYFAGDYESSWRHIREDEPSVAYAGTWEEIIHESYHNFAVQRSIQSGSQIYFEFFGDRLNVIGAKGANHSANISVYIDDVFNSSVSEFNASDLYKQTIFTWSGSYAAHSIRMVNMQSNKFFEFDAFQGNLMHSIYMRSAYDHNLAMLGRLSEITNTWLKFNFDGTLDLLGASGDEIGVVLREGENEGGQITHATVANDYSEVFSAALALVNGPNDLPIKSFVVDKTAVEAFGLKIGRVDNTDSLDAFLLTRQAWQWLQDHKIPRREYDIQYIPDFSTEGVDVGDSPVFHIPTVNLEGQRLRIGKKTTEWNNETG